MIKYQFNNAFIHSSDLCVYMYVCVCLVVL